MPQKAAINRAHRKVRELPCVGTRQAVLFRWGECPRKDREFRKSLTNAGES